MSGFTAPGSPSISGVLLPPSPTRGSLQRPDWSATGSQSPALQATSILVLDTFASHPIPSHPHPSLKSSKKWVSSGEGGVWGCPDQKLITGCVYWRE